MKRIRRCSLKPRVITQAEFVKKATVVAGGCWTWNGGALRSGYGRLWHSDPLDQNYRRTYAHRVAHMLFKGPIPEGMEIDHICFNRRCVNPDHLRLVTPSENRARFQGERKGGRPSLVVGGKCLRGHQLTPEVLATSSSGKVVCRSCQRERGAAQRSARRAAIASTTGAQI